MVCGKATDCVHETLEHTLHRRTHLTLWFALTEVCVRVQKL